MSAAVIGSVAAPIIGGLLGNAMSQGDRAEADRLRQQALQQFMNVQAPGIEEQKLLLEQLKSQGQLTPEMEQAISQQSSQMANISTDPRLKQAQMQALASMQGIANEGGMNAQDKVRFNQIQSESNRNAGAQQAALMQDFARRGQGGSGMELAAQLANQQGAAERASSQGMDVKAQAEQRALQAMMSAGQMGGQMQAQDFGQQAQQATAQDSINRFNAQNSQSVQSRNVGMRNDAQASNLQNTQRIADANTATRNQQQAHNKSLLQTQFGNQMDRAAGMAGQYQNQAGAKNAAADRTAGMYAGIGQGVGQGVAAYGTQKKRKEDEEGGF